MNNAKEYAQVTLLLLFVFSPIIAAIVVGDSDIAWFTFGTAFAASASAGGAA
jgi:hypothetical protein